MIPKEINYIFGLNSDFINKPFCYFHFLNILSSFIINKGYKINVFYHHKPNNKWFQKLDTFCNLVHLKNIPETINGTKFRYTEHICDLLRLSMLYKSGGIYLDIDTVCVKPFDNLLDNKCVMGKEYGQHDSDIEPKLIGLCNATILCEPNSDFIGEWLNEFNVDYRTEWNYNCVQMPYNLSQHHPEKLSILESNAFFKYAWDNNGRKSLFTQQSDISDCYSIHLWESKNYDLLEKYDADWINTHDDTISNLYKKFYQCT